MSVSIRRPDVETLYPTRLAYERAFAPVVRQKGPRATLDEIARLDFAGAPARARQKGFTAKLSGEAARRTGTTIVSEYEGRIDSLLLTLPKSEDELLLLDPRLGRHYRRLFDVFRSADFIVVGDPSQLALIEEIRARVDATGRLDFVESPKFQLSVWAQDAYVAVSDRRASIMLVEGVAFTRFDDMTIADDVAAQTKVGAIQSPLYFQGGNILGGSKRTLIGLDYVAKNMGRFGMRNQAEVEEQFSQLFDTPVLTLGGEESGNYDMLKQGILSGGHQPIFHIDMYVTQTGVIDKKSGKEIVFLGRPEMAKRVTGHYSDILHLDTPVYDGLFRQTARQLSKHFVVRSLPLWITYGNLRDPRKRSKYYNLTWNNALVENDGGHLRVFLPQYGNAADARQFGVDPAVRSDLDQAAAEAWRDLGFQVAWTDGVEDLAWGDGSVHCMTKTLRRSTGKKGSRLKERVPNEGPADEHRSRQRT